MLLELPAVDCARICAVAAASQRDLMACAEKHRDLFPSHPYDPTFYCTTALVHAFCAPWLNATQLRMANRSSLWVFGVDLPIDCHATTRDEVRDIVSRCLAVTLGAPPTPGDPVTSLLAELRDELGAHPVWVEETRLTLEAMALEWDWKNGSVKPSLKSYLDNAHNLGFAFVFASHWIGAGETCTPAVRDAAWQVQRVLRLANDLGTYRRDVEWGQGDLNALLLTDRSSVLAAFESSLAESLAMLAPLGNLPLAVYLRRMLEFNKGFWPHADYWGEL